MRAGAEAMCEEAVCEVAVCEGAVCEGAVLGQCKGRVIDS